VKSSKIGILKSISLGHICLEQQNNDEIENIIGFSRENS
jgi:hypothetical protein